ncbi:dihydrolipoamide acetyltransferase family protein [Deinococcus soli (ex Cha et al. 2016)]|uniref:Dihydrolipoamide acetyltransferase component of pyruvate dehydrogenase complex n=2 Tax=Deinococcus soli (ex Cha et al. 2016) TaxID=1309411 RepID=A0AAE4BQ16_9DEIO|nr:dihydrolipoamide acetyltransferase family protein [Deinococcus soli (ex Cha et al. 2016)]MDR6220789.1 pyruvate dehydrogenase E2 component (dihydrolipoamide acetyltransferase) [Deinococcus soli (ex Cha et al. 2016)]MDR6330811.1 pyruvate dehydrogenase E2 component (dihydrolipoamide acetyltransferase) [Deinococcus soli (ex Cha et al. 2016)]MDR6753888.1 pyruvate dehydrogenase E2 component (dihydrolipoamide acetyltransferase) [Deinococcus soli (ex Cha et al. 2016)]
MKEVLLPELAESVVEGEILKWLVQEGDTIALEQPLCEVMTDKVTVELPSPVAGVLSRRLAGEGDVVAVHAAIALIDETGGAAAAPAPAATAPAPAAAPLSTQAQEEREQVGGSIVEAGHLQKGADDDSTSLFKAFSSDEKVQVQGLGARQPAAPAAPTQPTRADGRVLAVPAARQLARELNLDLTQVRGSGPNGRIRVSDVLAHQGINQGQSAPAQPAAPAQAPAQAAQPAAAPAAKAPAAGGLPVAPVQYRTPKGYEHLEDRVPLRGMRRAISNQMQASHLYTVRTLTVDEVNLSKLVEFRARVKDDAAAAGVKLSYLPFIFKAVAVALRKFPSLNTSFDEATQEIVQKRYYNIGMAVATDAGLTVPVLKDVNHKSVFDLAREVSDLAVRAQGGKLQADELAGSTFSVTNIGSIGALFSFPIINVPDAAILGIHSIQKRPIVDEYDNIVVAHMMYLSLSFDHRLVDGAEAARFCKEVIRLLENPDRLMLEAM